MPCLGARKKSSNIQSQSHAGDIRSGNVSVHPADLDQLKRENAELKSKNKENLAIIAKQAAEIDDLKEKLHASILSSKDAVDHESKTDVASILSSDKAITDEKHISQTQQSEHTMTKEIDEDEVLSLSVRENSVNNTIAKSSMANNKEESLRQLLLEKDSLLEKKQLELEQYKQQWEIERAELTKPALEQVTKQLEELRDTNKLVTERLNEKENELAELRSELNRRERKPKQSLSKDEENQRRLNRLTVDLENDRLLMQRLNDLNQQLEAQKKKHETVLEAHAKVLAEKEQALLQKQKTIKELKISKENDAKTLEQEHMHRLKKLQLQHETDMEELKVRLKKAENKARMNVDNELDMILIEFEQSQHNHSMQVAQLQKSYEDQISAMKLGRDSTSLPVSPSTSTNITASTTDRYSSNQQKTGTISKLKNNSKFVWPPVA
ncbi:hypothetical protein BDF20DRAFT_839044 [Mycotypha africana]|uniref:uncharacterized protein n=1 Tax=Mycotypha africana TaxID=64632 RepID=UPI0022FFE894|nr:uncharacterized protein BDF20DRAFT_839044 [Mycotypha africana]KAI8969086.1 hypothetical protein BDF20DRAFT_839044 [Mycotypha africana]